MVKSIYKITNQINNKSYIGQTSDITRRFQEHKNMKSVLNDNREKILYLAFIKYGIDNFDFAILESNVENYNEREKYWIKFYHTYILDPDCNGYNMTPGGEEPPTFHGEDHPMATHTQQEMDLIINLIRNTKLSFAQIAKQSNYHISSIERINKGELWFNEELEYPLRKENTKQFLKDRAEQIILDLKTTDLTQKEIANKYHVARTVVTAINNGQNFFHEQESYPIRKTSPKDQSKPIYMKDKDTLEILQLFNSSREAVRFLNKTDASAANIRLAAHHYPDRTAYGYKWEFVN